MCDSGLAFLNVLELHQGSNTTGHSSFLHEGTRPAPGMAMPASSIVQSIAKLWSNLCFQLWGCSMNFQFKEPEGQLPRRIQFSLRQIFGPSKQWQCPSPVTPYRLLPGMLWPVRVLTTHGTIQQNGHFTLFWFPCLLAALEASETYKGSPVNVCLASRPGSSPHSSNTT